MIFDLFSKRKKKAAGLDQADVYQYDSVPDRLRVQIQQILIDALGPQFEIDPYAMITPRHNPSAWKFIHKTLCRELGQHDLAEGRLEIEQVMNFIGNTGTDNFVDAVELSCKMLSNFVANLPEHDRANFGIKQAPNDAVNEINYRFRESRFGFQFEDGFAFQIDSEFAHEEVVKPALRILTGPGFEGAQEEFLNAHRHYRAGDNEQAIVELAKSFESTLKAVCAKRGWQFESGARASDLLKLVKANGLWPEYLDGSFDQLLATLKSGLPKMRNEQAAHGQGQNVRSVPRYVAAYAMNLAASKIVFVADAAAHSG